MLNKEGVQTKSCDKQRKAALLLLTVDHCLRSYQILLKSNMYIFKQVTMSHLHSLSCYANESAALVLDVGEAAQGRVKHTLNRLQMKSLNTHSLPLPPLLCLSPTENACLIAASRLHRCLLLFKQAARLLQRKNKRIPLKWLLLTTDL